MQSWVLPVFLSALLAIYVVSRFFEDRNERGEKLRKQAKKEADKIHEVVDAEIAKVEVELKEKKDRLYKFVNKLVEDEISWNKMRQTINLIKDRRNKEISQNNV